METLETAIDWAGSNLIKIIEKWYRFCRVIRRNPLFESSSLDQLPHPRCCNFLRAPPSSFCRNDRRGVRGLWGLSVSFSLVPTRHSLRNLPMINDRLAAHSFKQQSFPREKIFYIRNERNERLFLSSIYPSRLRSPP